MYQNSNNNQKDDRDVVYIHSGLVATGKPLHIIAKSENQYLARTYGEYNAVRYVYFSVWDNDLIGKGLTFHWLGTKEEMYREFERWNPEGIWDPFLEALNRESD